MLNRWASLAMSTSILKALPSKLDIKRHSPTILYLLKQGYHYHKIRKAFPNSTTDTQSSLSKTVLVLKKNLLQQGISKPVLYGV